MSLELKKAAIFRYIGEPGRAKPGQRYRLEVSQDFTTAVSRAPMLDPFQDTKLFNYPGLEGFEKDWVAA